MQTLTEQILSKLIAIRKANGENADVGDMAMLVNELLSFINELNDRNNNDIYTSIRDIGDKIAKVKQDIAENLPHGMTPEAALELDAVVKATEDATNKILDSVENIRNIALTLGDPGVVCDIEKEIATIFEACNFQDITGQRIKKVTNTLKYIENSIGSIIKNLDVKTQENIQASKKPIEELEDKDLMNGPQLSENAPSQDDVDRLFDGA